MHAAIAFAVVRHDSRIYPEVSGEFGCAIELVAALRRTRISDGELFMVVLEPTSSLTALSAASNVGCILSFSTLEIAG